jgi:aspartokinase
MKVLRFGGSSISTAENIQQVKKVIESQEEQVIVYNLRFVRSYGSTA